MRGVAAACSLLALTSCGMAGGLRVEPAPTTPALPVPFAEAPAMTESVGVAGAQVAKGLSVRTAPVAIAFSPEAVWALFTGAQTRELARLDPTTGVETAPRQPLPVDARGLAVSSADGVWLSGHDRVFRIDPTTGVATTSIALDGSPGRILLAHGALLVLVHAGTGGELEAFDPTSGHRRWHAPVGPGPVALTTWRGQVWVADHIAHDLRSFDQDTGRTISVRQLPGARARAEPVELSARRDALLVCLTDQLMVLPDSVSQPVVTLGHLRALAFAASPHGLWVLATTPSDPTPALYRVDSALQPIRLGGDAVAIATGGGQVWVANRGLNVVTHAPDLP